MTKESKGLEVWIVQFSKSGVDDICDSSIQGVYATEEQAKEVCKQENQDNIRSYENWHYYYEKYVVSDKNKTTNENVLMKSGECPMCKTKIDGLEKIQPCPCGRIFCTNCHFELKHSDVWMVEA